MKTKSIYTIADSNELGVIHCDLVSGEVEMMEPKRILFGLFHTCFMSVKYIRAYNTTWSACACTGNALSVITDINLN